MKRLNINVNGFQKDDKTGLILPETYFEDHNTVENDILYYLAYKIGTNTVNQCVDSRFAAGGALAVGDNTSDGIAHGASSTTLDYKLATSLVAGTGTGSVAYTELLGSIAGAVTLNGYLYIGFNYVHASTAFTKTYFSYNISQTVAAGRTFYFYWRITLG